MYSMIDFKCPKGERIWMQYATRGGEIKYVLTSKNASRDFYYLYEVCGKELNKLGRGKSPSELENKFDIKNKIK